VRLASLCALLVAASGCAHARRAQTGRHETVEVGRAVFRVQYGPEDAGAARQVRAALERAVPAAERWGEFSAPVLITIHPTHEALEQATHRDGYAWLRAWTRYDSVELQSPRTWSSGNASDAQMEQLLTHELTHCVMYQVAGSELTWRDREIPIWFREGMAIVTAGENPRPRVDGRFGPGRGDPLAAPELLVRSQSSLVYATANRAFRFLLGRHGEERVRRLIATMGEGLRFPEAFQEALGISVREFEEDFRRHEPW